MRLWIGLAEVVAVGLMESHVHIIASTQKQLQSVESGAVVPGESSEL